MKKINPIHSTQREAAKIKIKEIAETYNFVVDVNTYEKATTKLDLTCKNCQNIIKKSWGDLQNAGWYNRPIICYSCNPKVNTTTEKRSRLWSKHIKRKYNYECVACGKTHNQLYKENIALDAHHIVPYAVNTELRNSLDNGAPLCYNCHNYYHTVWEKNTQPKTIQEYKEDFNNFLLHLTNKNLKEIKDSIKELTLVHITEKIKKCLDGKKQIYSYLKNKYNSLEYSLSWETFLYKTFNIENLSIIGDTDIYKPKELPVIKYTWDEHKEFVSNLKCENQQVYNMLCEFHPELYKTPNEPFRSQWISWPDFLNNKKYKRPTYFSYEEASEYCQKLNIHTSREYWEISSIEEKLPHMPSHQYKSSWISWQHFLNWDSRKKSRIY